jgi:hypothetical protein
LKSVNEGIFVDKLGGDNYKYGRRHQTGVVIKVSKIEPKKGTV